MSKVGRQILSSVCRPDGPKTPPIESAGVRDLVRILAAEVAIPSPPPSSGDLKRLSI